eukprot:1194106-Prorocentrum_minimum.AAC.2
MGAQAEFPGGLVNVDRLEFSMAHVNHRYSLDVSLVFQTDRKYLLAEGSGSLFVVFMGTKHIRDWLTDANVLQVPLWTAENGGWVPVGTDPLPAVHRGFLQRAQQVPVMQLYQMARRKGLRLVFCGHSLGGAVAAICTVMLMKQLSASVTPDGCVPLVVAVFGNRVPLLPASDPTTGGWLLRARNLCFSGLIDLLYAS